MEQFTEAEPHKDDTKLVQNSITFDDVLSFGLQTGCAGLMFGMAFSISVFVNVSVVYPASLVFVGLASSIGAYYKAKEINRNNGI